MGSPKLIYILDNDNQKMTARDMATGAKVQVLKRYDSFENKDEHTSYLMELYNSLPGGSSSTGYDSLADLRKELEDDEAKSFKVRLDDMRTLGMEFADAADYFDDVDEHGQKHEYVRIYRNGDETHANPIEGTRLYWSRALYKLIAFVDESKTEKLQEFNAVMGKIREVERNIRRQL